MLLNEKLARHSRAVYSAKLPLYARADPGDSTLQCKLRNASDTVEEWLECSSVTDGHLPCAIITRWWAVSDQWKTEQREYALLALVQFKQCLRKKSFIQIWKLLRYSRCKCSLGSTEANLVISARKLIPSRILRRKKLFSLNFPTLWIQKLFLCKH